MCNSLETTKRVKFHSTTIKTAETYLFTAVASSTNHTSSIRHHSVGSWQLVTTEFNS